MRRPTIYNPRRRFFGQAPPASQAGPLPNPDLWHSSPADIQSQVSVDPNVDSVRSRIADIMQQYPAAILITQDFTGIQVAVQTTPTLIINSSYTQCFLLLNPAKTVGTSSVVTVTVQTGVSTAGNSETNPINVLGFLYAHLFMNVSSISGTWDFFLDTWDSTTNSWVDSQDLFPAVTGTGEYYADVGAMGIAQSFAIRWNPTVAGTVSFTISAVLKGGLGGTNAGVSQTIFLGGSAVSPTNGFGLIEGANQQFVLYEGTQLYGVALVPLTLMLFKV